MHAVLLFGDFRGMDLFSTAAPQLKTVTMTLVAYTPDEKGETPPAPGRDQSADRAPEAIERIDDILPAPQPQLLPLPDIEESFSDAPPLQTANPAAAFEPREPVETVQARPKPKRSLKALTKVISSLSKTSRDTNPDQAKQSASIQKTDPELSEVPARSGDISTSIDGQPDAEASPPSSLTSALKDAADAVASANQRVPAPTISLARPLYRHNPSPDYPSRARRRGLQGVVILKVLVDEKGRVDDLVIFKSSGHKILDRAARSSVKRWMFQPGTKDGRTIEMWVRVPIRFELK